MQVRLGPQDIKVGSALPWPVYDWRGKLLLRKGYIVGSEKQLMRLLSAGLYRESKAESDELAQRTGSPFATLEDIVQRIGRLLDGSAHSSPEFAARVVKLADQLIDLCNGEPDAALGFVQLYQDAPYIHYHPMKIAILSSLLGQSFSLDASRQRALACACLTCNIAILELQSVLQVQSEPLLSDQSAEIHAHPGQSAALLATLGVDDPDWLATVRHHHERCDGSGYPQGLDGEAIPLTARILAVADRYAASTSSRSYKRSLTPIQALKAVFVEHQENEREYDPQVVAALIRTLGVYPPGSTVQLVTGERAVVIRRNPQKSTEPVVAAVESAEGKPYGFVYRRDTGRLKYKIKQPAPLQYPLRLPLSYVWGYGELLQAPPRGGA